MKTKSKRPAKTLPKTEAEWCAYRCQSACRIGKHRLDRGWAPINETEEALFALLEAIEELSKQLAATNAVNKRG